MDTLNEQKNETQEVKEPKKRGRKPNPNNKNYFGSEEEKAFQEYLYTEDKEKRDRIFKEKLTPAFTKMIESIIRRYNLFTPSENFEDTFNDTMSFLVTKVSNFKPDKAKKAYSYCGTVCKNYLILKRSQAMKNDKRFLSYDTMYTESNPDNRVVEGNSVGYDSFNRELMFRVMNNIGEVIERGYWDNGDELSDSEEKVGSALMEILNNWESLFMQMDDTQKFNKTNVLYFIKENTMLSTKAIRDAMKKFKLTYFSVKDDYVNED